tara:strand:+ start:38 stop:520 length:483 start_codon:yes stop_codon:yes gene_type:complete
MSNKPKHIGSDVISLFKYDEVNGGVMRTKWEDREQKVPIPNSAGYILYGVYIDSVASSYTAHRLTYLLNYPDMDQSLHIDHINGVRTDNRIENLRTVTHQHNTFNQTKAKGFSWMRKCNAFQAYICVDYKIYYLGLHDTILDARAAYLRAKKKYHIIEEG